MVLILILIRFARSLRFFASLMMVAIILLLFLDFSWRSGLLEYWIPWRPYVRGHWFGCSLWPGTPLNTPCQEIGFIRPFVVIDPTDLGATTLFAAVLMLDTMIRQHGKLSRKAQISVCRKWLLFFNPDLRYEECLDVWYYALTLRLWARSESRGTSRVILTVESWGTRESRHKRVEVLVRSVWFYPDHYTWSNGFHPDHCLSRDDAFVFQPFSHFQIISNFRQTPSPLCPPFK